MPAHIVGPIETEYPVEQITDFVGRGLARLAQQLKESQSHAGLIGTVLAEVQAVEDALFPLIFLRSVDAVSGAQLDALGRVVGSAREGAFDPAYRLKVKARILLNRRSGEIDTIARILRLLVPSSSSVNIVEGTRADFEARILGTAVADAVPLWQYTQAAKAGGVRGLVRYQTAAEADRFTFAGGTGKGLGDYTTPGVGGKLSGLI